MQFISRKTKHVLKKNTIKSHNNHSKAIYKVHFGGKIQTCLASDSMSSFRKKKVPQFWSKISSVM